MKNRKKLIKILAEAAHRLITGCEVFSCCAIQNAIDPDGHHQHFLTAWYEWTTDRIIENPTYSTGLSIFDFEDGEHRPMWLAWMITMIESEDCPFELPDSSLLHDI